MSKVNENVIRRAQVSVHQVYHDELINREQLDLILNYIREVLE